MVTFKLKTQICITLEHQFSLFHKYIFAFTFDYKKTQRKILFCLF